MFRQAVLAASLVLALVGCRDEPTDAPSADSGPGGTPDAAPPGTPDAAPPNDLDPTPAAVAYFSDIGDELADQALVNALHQKLANDHKGVSFEGLYDVYEMLDQGRDGCFGIYDFYSSKCWQPEEACGNYSREGDCYNREHSWPKSWWGGSDNPDQHEDIVAVIPADGYVNNTRAQLPLGNVVSATYASTNGSKRGICNVSGAPQGTDCFEPPNSLKGDFARIYFYMAVRYEGEFSCCAEPAVNRSDILPWQEEMLRQWHRQDPVDLDEQNRNELIFGIQENRNPFVDYPGMVDRIADF